MFLALGATGTGKSSALKAELEQVRLAPPGALPWAIIVDPDNEYGEYVARSRGTLQELVREYLQPQGARWFRFVPSDDRDAGVRQFSYLCGLAWISATRMRRDTLLLVDELAEFTKANEAPAAWRRIVKRGRKAGISILAASQRPAEIDKTIFSNASRIRVYRLGYDADQAAGAAALGVDRRAVAELEGHRFLERNALEGGGLVAGALKFSA